MYQKFDKSILCCLDFPTTLIFLILINNKMLLDPWVIKWVKSHLFICLYVFLGLRKIIFVELFFSH